MGKLIIFPTDTVYGIGCEIFDIENINKIYKIKNRSFDKPLACLCADFQQIEALVVADGFAEELIKRYLPGPLTIILEAKEEVVKKIGYKTIGIRIPNCKTALDLLQKNGPMLTTSVNDSGETPMNEYESIVEKYGSVVDEIYPTNEISSNQASTVISYIGGNLRLIREGSIKFNEIEAIFVEKNK